MKVMYRNTFFMRITTLCLCVIFSLLSIGNYCFSNNIDSNTLPYDTLPNGKIVLQWKEISPYVYMDKVCQDERIYLIYSDIKDLRLFTDQGIVYPNEALIVHEMIRKSNDPSCNDATARMIIRYAFCVNDQIQEITIKNGKSESLPINLASAFISKNVGLVLNEDKEYIDLMARAIEQAETQRSLALESLKVITFPETAANGQNSETAEKNDHYFGQSSYNSVTHDNTGKPVTEKTTPTSNYRNELAEKPVAEKNLATRDNREVPQETIPTTKPQVQPKAKVEKVIPVEKIKPAALTAYARDNFISTSTKNVAINDEKVAEGKNGNGYKVQIIAKLLSDHNAKSIQKYYNLPYTVEEHYDGTWHRYTISGYSNSWDQSYALMQEMRSRFGIEDAFISLYQDYERVGIYPCNTVGFAEWIQEKNSNGIEPLGSKEKLLAQNNESFGF